MEISTALQQPSPSTSFQVCFGVGEGTNSDVVNDAPTATAKPYTGTEDLNLTIALEGTDPDVNTVLRYIVNCHSLKLPAPISASGTELELSDNSLENSFPLAAPTHSSLMPIEELFILLLSMHILI